MERAFFKLLITLTLVSTNAFASGYTFSCSNKDNSIKIYEDSDKVAIHNLIYTSIAKLDNLAIWSPLEKAEVEIISAGKQIILHKEENNSCREIWNINFAQKLTIRDFKSKKILATDYFICENLSSTTSGGNCFPDILD